MSLSSPDQTPPDQTRPDEPERAPGSAGPAADTPSGPAADKIVNLREQTRQQMLSSLGGWSGTVISAIPLVVFIAVNAKWGLHPALLAAVGAGLLLAGYRLARREPIQHALTGLFSVAVAAAIAARTGQARGFFLLGIVSAIGYAAVFGISILVRRPLIGLVWEFLDPSPLPDGQRWHRVPTLFRAYTYASLAALAMFVARGVVQLSLFSDNKTGWLAVTKLAMGYPLYIVVVGFAFWVVRRARKALPDPAAGVEDLGGADGLPDGRLGLGQGDEK